MARSKYTNSEIIVLIVDDNLNNIQLLGNILQNEGYKIVLATNGDEALAILNEIEIDLILLDIMMPQINGFEVCKRFKENKNIKDAPVIFLSAKKEIEDIINGFKCGGVDFITKPFNKHELLARIGTHLELKFVKELLLEQNELLQKQNKQITDGIKYAYSIQQSILPSITEFGNIIPKYFILQSPKNIISGDFFWYYQRFNKTYIAIADCTGHGVPASLISMLGVTFLNEIVNIHSQYNAAQILNALRTKIKTSLKQTSCLDFVTDGLDIAFCILDRSSNRIQFSGAYRPLILFRTQDGKNLMTELIPDDMSVGIDIKETSFTNYIIDIQPNDMFYMFSDGFCDQTIEQNNEKIGSKRFYSLLDSICHKPLTEQKEILSTTLNKLKGSREQEDDILILGIRY